ncbi:hypothetical protein [Actinomadura terrae]|uniref:hypothetical protein n=1 Tax=Actinomadura terrae TaxID=604353 RepID=UPI001FA714C4|nr:hypothetical protein [Actinomadura terrae]
MARSSGRARPDSRRRRRHRYARKLRRLAQAALFAAVRGGAYALGGAVVAWVLYWLAQLI